MSYIEYFAILSSHKIKLERWGGALDVRPERAEIKTENASQRNNQKKKERDRMEEEQR